ncbi:MAG: aquaporin [Sporichthyaceae bacterium]
MLSLPRRALAEFVGTAMLVAVVVGSGIMATQLSPNDVGLQLLENSLVTALGLGALILAFGPVSGAHFNPVVTVADWLLKGRPGRDVPVYALAQTAGAIAGAILADAMFDVDLVNFSGKDRSDANLLLGEVVATGGLVFLIFSLVRSGRAAIAPAAVGAYIGAAYWFTSSTSFANPAVTVGRAFTDTFAGIEPASVPGFVVAQILGGALGLALLVVLYPDPARGAEDVVVPSLDPREEPSVR